MLGGAVGWGLTLAGSKLYRANIQLFVATSSSQSALGLAHGNPFVPDRVQSYISIATSPAVTGPVIHRLGLSLTEPELAAKISADAPQNKVLINLHVTDHNPRAATRIANAVAAQFATVVENTEKADAHGKSIVRVSVIHPAIVPSSPISPDATLKIGLGGLVGLLLGAGVVIARAQ
ncbi:MAG: hypothetical protein J2P16_17775 [Mycobacterium sp.]|nr:hypothetical protein [Mycobacterium sp.]